VRKTPSRPRSRADFSLLSLGMRVPTCIFFLLGQPNTFLAQARATASASRRMAILRSASSTTVRYLDYAFGAFGIFLQENISVFHPSSLKMVPKTPNASYTSGKQLWGSWHSRILEFDFHTGEVSLRDVIRSGAPSAVDPILAKVRERRQVGPEVGPTAAFYSCISTGMHGPICIFWANL
jgi:hypothetical protein